MLKKYIQSKQSIHLSNVLVFSGYCMFLNERYSIVYLYDCNSFTKGCPYFNYLSQEAYKCKYTNGNVEIIIYAKPLFLGLTKQTCFLKQLVILYTNVSFTYLTFTFQKKVSKQRCTEQTIYRQG